ncbi:MAG: GreA/GreB family elongation factor [Deltaproteobacteria bacterium]|nr:GreA/GreB family elongation factor [Deltaproteobacteria bacterium]
MTRARRPGPSRASLREELLALLTADLDAMEKAQRATVEGATHAEARAEDDKDTRALEQTYLARGQAARVEQLRDAVAQVHTMPLDGAGDAVTLGSLVTAEHDDGGLVVWIAPQGGGKRLAGSAVQVVTPQSPLGAALLGRRVGDECELRVAGKLRVLNILSVR